MILFDVNMLVYAHREDAANHRAYHDWLLEQLNSPRSFAVSRIVLSGFLRVVTHTKVFALPSPIGDALAFVETVLNRENAVIVEPGERHWQIFSKLCIQINARGNLIPDCYLAAIAIENGCTFATSDRDYTRFRDLDVEIVSF